jgi:hypothetical protein
LVVEEVHNVAGSTRQIAQENVGRSVVSAEGGSEEDDLEGGQHLYSDHFVPQRPHHEQYQRKRQNSEENILNHRELGIVLRKQQLYSFGFHGKGNTKIALC